jgi:hypothetical protein
MEKLISKFWRGEVTLWKSYWLVGELFNALFILAIFNFEIFFFNNQFSNSLPFINFNNFNLLSKSVLIIWTIFITVGIWRSAEKYRGSLFWIICVLLFLSYRVFTLRLIFFG